jgi:transcriptional regulator with XRE-family HTH domain
VNPIQERLGERVRTLRMRRRWNQEELAEISGLHRTYVGAIERGEKNLTISTLRILAKTFETTISNLFRGIA